MNEDQLIISYKFYIDTGGTDNLPIPQGHEEGFWSWLGEKGRGFELNKISKSLKDPNLLIYRGNTCYKNSYRIMKAFRKRYFYWEGFAYHSNSESFVRHAFNVSKHGRIIDYSLNYPIAPDVNTFKNYYFGVKIPESFERSIYAKLGDYGQHSMYSLLVPYYLFLNGFTGYEKYACL